MRVGVAREVREHGAQQREDRRLPRALLLGEGAGRRAHDGAQAPAALVEPLERARAAQRVGDGREQHRAARGERLHVERAPARREGERRVDEAEVVARVAARHVAARGEQEAAALVERRGERRQVVRIRQRLDVAAHAHASRACV